MIRVIPPLLLILALVFALSLGLGDQPLGMDTILDALAGEGDPSAILIVREVRLPRALLGLLVGMALAVAGTISQTVMRNPLADPGILGINSGAALAALMLVVLFERTAPHLVSLAAFAGAFAMAIAIYVLSWRGRDSSIRIILIGIGLSALAGAASGFISAFGDITAVQQATVWLAGSLYNASWNAIGALAVWLSLPLLLTMAAGRELDLMQFSELSSRGLGQRVQLMRALLILLCTLLSGAAVAAAGLIGFIGLIAPHAARRLVGHRHVLVVPVAGLIGSALVLTADLAGRTIIAPAQLPAGLLTALLGAPFFALLLWNRRHARL